MFGSPPTRLPPLRGELVYACVGCVQRELGGVSGVGRGMPIFSTETSGVYFDV